MLAAPTSAEAAAPKPAQVCQDEQPDAAAAGAMVGVCGRRVEILAERTEWSQMFVNVDGSRTLEQTIEPTRVRKGKSWGPVDTTLKVSAEGITPRATVLPMVFSSGGDAPLARLRDGEREVTMTWPGRLPTPVLEGATAVYRDVLPDVDLRVTAQPMGFSEVLVVKSRQAATSAELASLRFGLATKGVTVSATTSGGLAARDGKGAIVFAAPAPMMWDSSDAPEADALAGPAEKRSSATSPQRKPSTTQQQRQLDEQASVQVKPSHAEIGETARRAVMPVRVDGQAMTIVPDKAMLADPRTKLPIYIDPSWTGGIASNAWTSVWSKYKSSSFWKNSSALNNGSTYGSAGAGRTEDCSGCADHIVRSLFRMNIARASGTEVTKAEFRIEQRHAWTCSPVSNAKLWKTGAISSSTTWNNQPTWDSSRTAQVKGNRKHGAAHGCLGTGTIEFNVTTMVKEAAKNRKSELTVGLRAIDESTKKQWKRFNHSSPKLAITFNNRANAPSDRKSDGKGCATGASRPYVLTTTPELSAKHSDPNGDQQSLRTDFHWWQVGGARNDTDKMSSASGNPGPASKAIPAGKLTDGRSYVWQARTWDGSHYGDWSGTCEFTVDATPPPPPATVSSTNYTNDGVPRGGVGLSGTFTLTAPTTRPYEVKEYAYSLDSGVLTAAKTVAARTSDYGASLSVAPRHDGVNILYVWSKDHAGRFSTPVTYTFTVRAGSGPAGEWTFDETGTTATDDSGHGNALTIGASASRVAGRSGLGTALSLPGNTAASKTGTINTPHPDTGVSTPVRTDASFTVTAWVKISSLSGSGAQAVVSANGSRMPAYHLGYVVSGQRWRFTMATADTDNAPMVSVHSNAAPTAGKWTHLAATFDGASKKMTLYVNGVAQTETVTLSGGFNATSDFSVGRRKWNGGYDSFFTGVVDDVRFYNFVETATNLAKLAVPLPPAVTFPNGSEATAGGQLTVRFDARGDTNVTKFRYSIDGTGLGSTVNATTAGGTATVTVDIGSGLGPRPVYAVAVDDGNRVSDMTTDEFTARPAASLSGTVWNEYFMPQADVVVQLQPGGHQATSAADGSYAMTGFAPGTYTITATLGGRCGLSFSAPLEIDGQGTTYDILLAAFRDDLGHTCTEQTTTFTTASTALALTGDDAVATVPLPFAFPFYGGAYRSAWVDTNGLLTFTDPGGSHPYTGQQPAPVTPAAAVAPFWDDLVVDASASVRTATTGSGAGQRFVVEWRNVHRKGNTGQRVSFATVLAPDGTVTTNYDQLDNAAERGAHAVVGIEAEDGQDRLRYSTAEPVLASSQAITFTRPESEGELELHSLSGALTNAAGAPVVGATVTLDPSGVSTTTGAGGAYSFTGLVADSYTVSVQMAGRCGALVRSQVELFADEVRDLRLGPDYGGLGYACSTGPSAFVSASTVLGLTGDDAATMVALPFPVRFHGESYTSGRVHTNGLVSFGPVSGEPDTWVNPTMPALAAPNAVVAPFWDDFEVDASASVRTQTVGSAPNRSFVVEWRNVGFRPTNAQRVTFEVIFHEDGRIAFHYGAMSTPTQQGAGATVGLENASGTVAALYSFQEAVLTANSSITYTPASAGTVEGVLTTAVTGNPVAGATVTLNPGNRSTTTAADGSYQFTAVPVGEYKVAASTGDSRCAGQYAREIINHPGGVSEVDLSVMVDGDEFGYKCTAGARTFVPGDTVEAWQGDETVWQKNPPFPVKLYGETYTSAWISANGLISFKDPAYFGWIGSWPGSIPSPAAEGSPNAAVYVLWDDWVVDSQARIATKVSGTAPNRQWVVEWRNVHIYGDTSTRATFEVVFKENGEITLAYADIDPNKSIERGGEGTVGIENGDGSIGFQYLFREPWLASGQGVTFTPNPPGQGSVSGTVTCQGTAVAGATITVADRTTTTAANGTYQITAVPAGSWAVIATVPSGACRGSDVRQVVVGTNTQATADYSLGATVAGGGYRLTEQPVTYTPANGTVLSLTGDDAYTSIALPFPVSLYGQTYNTGWVDTNGLVSFLNPGEPSPDAWPIPSPASPEEPNAALYPFWHDWVVDANASIRTAVRGTAPNRQFVIEWRNVHSYEDPRTRVTFQAILDEAGGYSFAYTDNDGTFLERGGGATIGIENADGTAAIQYTYRQSVLRPGLGLRFNPPTP
ncbi:carboxypeptidase regulatory-like domain-containing protein [Verrucosispora sioxanthis]|uniref:DNRLRE domain-containing protein n=1 Tax=Verrucosispora sioxanthis TaxID=2499994 RepID=A0A6M1L9X2_9ACTN|nr:carboxypeptidase regulatory-like domain-containing protein [Verrucosispora sioxanthis]NEE65926.1 DNRLRE domain-containing protein [Verrucosispora sioxanthis]NGM15036.1 DNRLRE domain-containing protein [Verrucosispora sioxanthis]